MVSFWENEKKKKDYAFLISILYKRNNIFRYYYTYVDMCVLYHKILFKKDSCVFYIAFSLWK